MKKNKGFTLVELLAMLVVLGMLMAVAVPNITGILDAQKENIIRADARKMVSVAKIQVLKDDKVFRPANGQCYVFSLKYLNVNEDIGKGPYGNDYYPKESFVVYTKENHRYKYYVRLLEKSGSKGIGFGLIQDTSILDSVPENEVELIGLNESDAANNDENKNTLISNSLISSKCTNGVLAFFEK